MFTLFKCHNPVIFWGSLLSEVWVVLYSGFRKLQLQVVIVLFLALYFAPCQSCISFIAVLCHSLLHSQWARFLPPTHVLSHAGKFHCTSSSISFYRVASFSHLCPLLNLGFVAVCSTLTVWSAALLDLKLKKHLCTEKLRWSRRIAGLGPMQGPLQTRQADFSPEPLRVYPFTLSSVKTVLVFTPRSSSFFKYKHRCTFSLSGSSQVSEGQCGSPGWWGRQRQAQVPSSLLDIMGRSSELTQLALAEPVRMLRK